MTSEYRVYYWIANDDGRPKLKFQDFEDWTTADKFCEQQKLENHRLFGRTGTVWLKKLRKA